MYECIICEEFANLEPHVRCLMCSLVIELTMQTAWSDRSLADCLVMLSALEAGRF
jgi:hypothetical protein